MAETTGIEWCDSTFNPWIGCVKVGPGCDHCYAETLMLRFGRDLWGQDKMPERTKTWGQPRKWQRNADKFFAEHGRKRRVFAGSLCDPFDNRVPPEWRDDYFGMMRECPDLTFIVVTKRIGNAAKMMPRGTRNIWLLATVVTQKEADRDIPKLLATDAHIRGLSMEPLLEDIYLRTYSDWLGRSEGGLWCPDCPERGVGVDPADHEHCLGEVTDTPAYDGLDWVIVGGESGKRNEVRDMDPTWARSIRDQCKEAGAAFLMKQMAHKAPIPDDLMIREYPNG